MAGSFVIFDEMESLACGAKFYQRRQKQKVHREYRTGSLHVCILEARKRFRDAVISPEIVPKMRATNQHRRARLSSPNPRS